MVMQFLNAPYDKYQKGPLVIYLSKEHKFRHVAFIDDRLVRLNGTWQNNEEKLDAAIHAYKMRIIQELHSLIGKAMTSSDLNQRCMHVIKCDSYFMYDTWMTASRDHHYSYIKHDFPEPVKFHVFFDILVEAGLVGSILVATHVTMS
ncbi:hypothetical protein [Sporolactobacillus nakayamae]|uniref:Uncharacterized protein n=1 Tax=Sporolactobacillus nakayamae TaxID=269670 RepID=A0A1I2SV41_9BACL|nr:hypothetical protein [Sporolactobacillus nakayamae]SFG55729.1 hypothetical protein SAMN02982927_02037 [Sporolactobacillus nakayamae]